MFKGRYEFKKLLLLAALLSYPFLDARVKCISNLTAVNKNENINLNVELEYELEVQTPQIVYENDKGLLKANLLNENDQTATIEYTIVAKKNDGVLEEIANPVLSVSFDKEAMVSIGSSSGDEIILAVRAEKI